MTSSEPYGNGSTNYFRDAEQILPLNLEEVSSQFKYFAVARGFNTTMIFIVKLDVKLGKFSLDQMIPEPDAVKMAVIESHVSPVQKQKFFAVASKCYKTRF